MARTRLAPSPTGALHLGNARTFLINWAMARRAGWRVLLRLEDLDGPRVKPEASAQAVETLGWLGLDWDEGPITQSADLSPYLDAMRALAESGRAFPCRLSRTQIRDAASAPQEGVHETRFPPALRPEIRPRRFEREDTNWRLLVEPEPIHFEDRFAGPQCFDPASSVGDFVIWTKRGLPAYQLAVVVDDHRQGITEVVRGDDLLDSTARQRLLYRALGIGPEPAWTHLPLVLGHDGHRLAKRHGDTRLDTYRQRGATPERIVGLLARWCGLTPPDAPPTPMTAEAFASAFDLSTIPRRTVVFTPEDDAWLTQS